MRPVCIANWLPVICLQTVGQLLKTTITALYRVRSGKMQHRESGGTGRRAGFRYQWGNPWEFESPLSHQYHDQHC